MTKSKYSASPPSSRLPPDGHEFPSSNYEELIYPCDSSATSGRKLHSAGSRYGVTTSWRKNRSDERSESSVKDKIALFTKEEKKLPAGIPLDNRPITRPALSCSVDNLTSAKSATLPRLPVDNLRTLPHAIRDLKTTGSAGSERSRSLLDVTNSAPSNKRPSSCHVTSAQRKSTNGTSKLRGLIIPEASRTHPVRNQILRDLPEITNNKVASFNLTGCRSDRKPKNDGWDNSDSGSRKPLMSSLPWKTNSLSVPKYSPAFKRKELTVARSSIRPPEVNSNLPASGMIIDVVDGGHLEETIIDTDGDSAVSSSRSSFTPSGSPIPVIPESNKTSGTDADVSLNRVLKAQSVEALNRKNVLHSARSSSGGKGSGAPSGGSNGSVPSASDSRLVKVSIDIHPAVKESTSPNPSVRNPSMATSLHVRKPLEFRKLFANSGAYSNSSATSSSGDGMEIKTAFVNDVYHPPEEVVHEKQMLPAHPIKVQEVTVTPPTPPARR